MRWISTVWLAVVVLSGGLVWQARADDAPPPRHLWVNGVELSYIEQGTGTPVVFVHGAGGDLLCDAWRREGPTLVVGSEHTARYFALINEVVVRCIPGSRPLIIAQATHLMSSQNPAAFNEALLQFLAQR